MDWSVPLVTVAQMFWVSAVVGSICAYPIYKVLLKMKSRQIVSQHVEEHLKKQGTPTMGGLITVVGVLAAIGYALATRIYKSDLLYGSLIVFGGFALIGFADDYIVPKLLVGKRGLGWKQKLAAQILLAVAAAFVGRGGHVTAAGAFVSVFVILFFSNAYNFSDGMDGLAGSLLVLFAGGLVALGLINSQTDANLGLLGALVGGILPFLFLNAPPAKMFMGDVGALPIGALLGMIVDQMLRPGVRPVVIRQPESLGILPANTPHMLLPIAVISFVFIAELLPPPMQVASVKLFKRKIFPFTPIHHAFERAGWPETRVVWSFALVQALCSALAVGIALGMMQ